MVPSLNFYYTTSWSSLGEGYCRFFWTFNDDLIIVLRFINSNTHQHTITTRRVFSISSTECPTPATLLSAWTASCPKLPLPPSHSTRPSCIPYTCIAQSTDLLTSLTSAGPFLQASLSDSNLFPSQTDLWHSLLFITTRKSQIFYWVLLEALRTAGGQVLLLQ